MSNRNPSLLALLGLAAVAGYQNRDKIKDFIDRGRTDDTARAPVGTPDGRFAAPGQAEPGLLGNLQTGLAELVDRFAQRGDVTTARSWVGTGQNVAVTTGQLHTILGDDVINELAHKTGLSPLNLLSRLAQVLPDTVDRMTPDGRIDDPVELRAPPDRATASPLTPPPVRQVF